MGVMSRRVLPVCGSICIFCPSLRARSRQPVKRYKKLLADIFPRNQVKIWSLFFAFDFSTLVLVVDSVVLVWFLFFRMSCLISGSGPCGLGFQIYHDLVSYSFKLIGFWFYVPME